MKQAKFEPQRAVQTIARHYEAVARACVESFGEIFDTPENLRAVADLRSQKLLSMLDDNHGYWINGKVKQLVDYLEGHYRFRERHRAVQALIEEMDNEINRYQEALERHSAAGAEAALAAVRDCIFDLTEMLADILMVYNGIVDEDFSLAADLDEKQRQTERCLTELRRLQEIYEQLLIDRLDEKYKTQNPQLRSLLFKVLSGMITAGLGQLGQINQRLLKRLAVIADEKETRRLNHLIDAVAAKLESGFELGRTQYTLRPQFVLRLPLAVRGYPRLRNDDLSLSECWDRQLAKVRRKAGKKGRKGTEGNQPADIIDNRESVAELERDPLQVYLDYFFAAILASDRYSTLTASFGYEQLQVSAHVGYADWVFMVLSRYAAMKADVDAVADCREITADSPYPYLTGNAFIRDLCFTRRPQEKSA